MLCNNSDRASSSMWLISRLAIANLDMRKGRCLPYLANSFGNLSKIPSVWRNSSKLSMNYLSLIFRIEQSNDLKFAQALPESGSAVGIHFCWSFVDKETARAKQAIGMLFYFLETESVAGFPKDLLFGVFAEVEPVDFGGHVIHGLSLQKLISTS